jgi:protein-tyrosine phosphatase
MNASRMSRLTGQPDAISPSQWASVLNSVNTPVSLASFFSRSTSSRHSDAAPRYRVLMVCMGNICRSPTAEAVLRHQLQQAGLAEVVEVDSAGTHAYHVGSPPDERSQRCAAARGYDLSTQRARKVSPLDYERFDLILAMDWDNLALLEEGCPDDPALRRKLKRLTEFVPTHSALAGTQSVPDPYYGGPAGFDAVLTLVEAACEGLVQHLHTQVPVPASGNTLGCS